MPATESANAGQSPAGEFISPVADPIGLRAYFLDEGYVVVRDAVPKAWCEAAKAAFAREATGVTKIGDSYDLISEGIQH